MTAKSVKRAAVVFGCSASLAVAVGYKWIADTGNWSNSNNWYPSIGYPNDRTDDAGIADGNNVVTIDANLTIDDLTLAQDVLFRSPEGNPTTLVNDSVYIAGGTTGADIQLAGEFEGGSDPPCKLTNIRDDCDIP